MRIRRLSTSTTGSLGEWRPTVRVKVLGRPTVIDGLAVSTGIAPDNCVTSDLALPQPRGTQTHSAKTLT
jgi:hypothetical protein